MANHFFSLTTMTFVLPAEVKAKSFAATGALVHSIIFA